MIKLKRSLRSVKEGFKPNDNLSPSETAAVVSAWSRSNFSDSWKDDYPDGVESFRGDIRDTSAPMEIYVDKKNHSVSIYYLSLNKDDIEDYVRIGLDSSLDPDDAFVQDILAALSEDFSNEHSMSYKEINMPVTQVELENLLDKCRDQAVRDYNSLESAFYDAVEGKRESKKHKYCCTYRKKV